MVRYRFSVFGFAVLGYGCHPGSVPLWPESLGRRAERLRLKIWRRGRDLTPADPALPTAVGLPLVVGSNPG